MDLFTQEHHYSRTASPEIERSSTRHGSAQRRTLSPHHHRIVVSEERHFDARLRTSSPQLRFDTHTRSGSPQYRKGSPDSRLDTTVQNGLPSLRVSPQRVFGRGNSRTGSPQGLVTQKPLSADTNSSTTGVETVHKRVRSLSAERNDHFEEVYERYEALGVNKRGPQVVHASLCPVPHVQEEEVCGSSLSEQARSIFEQQNRFADTPETDASQFEQNRKDGRGELCKSTQPVDQDSEQQQASPLRSAAVGLDEEQQKDSEAGIPKVSDEVRGKSAGEYVDVHKLALKAGEMRSNADLPEDTVHARSASPTTGASHEGLQDGDARLSSVTKDISGKAEISGPPVAVPDGGIQDNGASSAVLQEVIQNQNSKSIS